MLFRLLPAAAAAADPAPTVSAACAVVMDADSGTVLYARAADEPGLIASTTKIMTGYLVCLDGELERPVTVPPEAVGVEGSSLYLQAGEILTREELLLGTMLQSGNDAALALAIDSAGSEEAFVRRMNETARGLGLTKTSYANPHGLDSEGNRSTARDLARLTAAALQNETFRRIVSTKSVVVPGNRVLTNHNRLLWRCPGCIGVKTGYTRAAGRILVSAAERSGRTLICVTMNDPDDWRDHMALFDACFARYQPRTVAAAGKPVARSAPPSGRTLVARTDLTLYLLPEESLRFEHVPGLSSDLLPGADAGAVCVYRGGCLVGRIPVTWGE